MKRTSFAIWKALPQHAGADLSKAEFARAPPESAEQKEQLKECSPQTSLWSQNCGWSLRLRVQMRCPSCRGWRRGSSFWISTLNATVKTKDTTAVMNIIIKDTRYRTSNWFANRSYTRNHYVEGAFRTLNITKKKFPPPRGCGAATFYIQLGWMWLTCTARWHKLLTVLD